jgi:hypothetical protein
MPRDGIYSRADIVKKLGAAPARLQKGGRLADLQDAMWYLHDALEMIGTLVGRELVEQTQGHDIPFGNIHGHFRRATTNEQVDLAQMHVGAEKWVLVVAHIKTAILLVDRLAKFYNKEVEHTTTPPQYARHRRKSTLPIAEAIQRGEHP